jgi:hypothetical protein
MGISGICLQSMKNIYGILLVLIAGCSANRTVTTWKTQHIIASGYQRIMVVAILPDEDSLTRDNIETSFTNTLSNLGYKAVTALSQFGRSGLRNLGEDETYIKVREKGIDAVITVALVNKTKETSHLPVASHNYRNNFFFNRIFQYKDNLTQPGNNTKDEQYYWECLLFDLAKLEASIAVQTGPSSKPTQVKKGNELARHLIRKMVKEKTLKKQKALKAF